MLMDDRGFFYLEITADDQEVDVRKRPTSGSAFPFECLVDDVQRSVALDVLSH